MKKITLHSVYISKDTGECLFECKLIDDLDFDRDIFTSLFVAITRLMRETLNKQLIDMRLEGMTLYTKAFQNIRVIVVVLEQVTKTAQNMNRVLDEIGGNFVSQFQDQLDYAPFVTSVFQTFDITLQKILSNLDYQVHQSLLLRFLHQLWSK